MSRVHLGASLVAHRRDAQYQLSGVLGGPSRWHHRRADVLIDWLDRLNYLDAELAREQEAA